VQDEARVRRMQATVSLSHSDTTDGLKRAIAGRIQALAKLHDLFVKSRWAGAELSRIAVQELAPYVEEAQTRVRIDGPQVLLSPNTAQAIGVTLHELATNAAKYGALSVANGRVEVTWSPRLMRSSIEGSSSCRSGGFDTMPSQPSLQAC
jgi:two-component sensor histidine kinase